MSIYQNPPKPGDEVTLLAYVNTALNGFELSPGDTGTISRIDGDDIFVDVVYTNGNPNSPYAAEYEDWFTVPYDEASEYFAGIILTEE